MGKQLTIPICFKLREFQPDQRKFKTASPIFEPADEVLVVIDVPLKHEHIYNSEDIIQAQIAGESFVSPLLTVAGWAFIEEAFLLRTDKTEEETEIQWED